MKNYRYGKPVNPMEEPLPVDTFFSFVSASFVIQQDDCPYPYFRGVTDSRVQHPYWGESPMRYFVRKEDGRVFCRHSQAGDGKFFPTEKTVESLVREWKDKTETYLAKSGYTLEDVTDEPLPPSFPA